MCLTNVLGPFGSITNVFYVNAKQDLFTDVFKHYVYVLIQYTVLVFFTESMYGITVCVLNYNTVCLYRRIIVP